MVESGQYQCVYCTPEQLLGDKVDYFLKNILNGNNEFMRRLMAMVVDECHCFSDWEEICPDYKALGLLREALCDIPFMALSTTLPPSVVTQGFITLGKRKNHNKTTSTLNRR